MSALERSHLGIVSTLLVIVIERGADTISDQPAEHATNRGARQPVAGSAPCDRRAEYGTGSRAQQSPGIFFRSRAEPIRASGAGRQHKAGDGDSGKFGSVHFDPRG